MYPLKYRHWTQEQGSQAQAKQCPPQRLQRLQRLPSWNLDATSFIFLFWKLPLSREMHHHIHHCSNADQPRGQQAESDSFIIPFLQRAIRAKCLPRILDARFPSRRRRHCRLQTSITPRRCIHLQEHGETGLPTALSGQMTTATFPSRPPGTPCSWSGAALPRRFGLSRRLPGRLCPGTWAASNGLSTVLAAVPASREHGGVGSVLGSSNQG